VLQPVPIEPSDVRVSTGHMPDALEVAHLLVEAHAAYSDDDDGQVATYIPALADVDPGLFGAAVTGVRGRSFDVGDSDHPFSLQSVSKPFVFALVCDAIGAEGARTTIGVNSTGLPFDSVMAMELNVDRTINPMVNAGAIATTSLVPGSGAEERWAHVLTGLSAFAGRALEVDDEVYRSEMASNLRNRSVAELLASYGRLHCDPLDAVEVYTRQCSLRVTAHDLSVMGATLANGGRNPTTGQQVIAEQHCKRVLAVLATAGLYERSGEWLYEIGLPGKSGVSGGIVAVAPGKGGLGTYSPRLDPAGNSVRGQRLTKHLSETLGLNLFASRPADQLG
jgi:glutaminase